VYLQEIHKADVSKLFFLVSVKFHRDKHSPGKPGSLSFYLHNPSSFGTLLGSLVA